MKSITKKAVLTGALMLVFALGVVTSASSQCSDYKWPEDGAAKAKAQESLVLLKDNKGINPKQAIAPFNWLVANAPDLNKSVYIYGAEVYDALAKKEKVEDKKAKYVDSLLIVYDLRVKNTPCDEVASIMNRKALAAYPYLINDARVKDLLEMMNKAVEMNGDNIMDGTLVPYMQTIMIVKLKYKTPADDEVIEDYDKLSDIISNKAKGGDPKKYNNYQSQVDDLFDKMGIPMNCDKTKARLEPKYRANPSDLDVAKKIFYGFLQGKCTDDPLWLETGEKVYKDKPEFGIAKNLAIKYLSRDNYDKAREWFKKALEQAEEKEDKVETLISLGSLEAIRGGLSDARSYYRQALSVDSGNKEAYERIGDLYWKSFDTCAGKEKMAEDRRVYLIAYDYYQKAGDGKKMNQAKEQFPSKEEIFVIGASPGTSTRVDCWINETTTWRTRD